MGDRIHNRLPIALSTAALVVAVLGATPFGEAAGKAVQTVTNRPLQATGLKAAAAPKPKRGPRGPRGLRGPRGPAGPPGATGPAGPAGPAGATGATGEKGASGEKGEQGLPGAKGDKGDKGDRGDQGPQGVQGVQGVQGAQGPAGTFSGTFRSENGLYSIRVTNSGIVLKGPGGQILIGLSKATVKSRGGP